MLAKPLLILGLAAIGSSFTFPDGLPNGSYRAYYNEAGEEVHEPVLTNTLNTTSSLPALTKREYSRSKRRANVARGSTQTWCGCNSPMNAGDTNVANAGLAKQAAATPRILAGSAVYTVQNTAVAFVCNVDISNSDVPMDIVSTGSWDVSDACGLFYAGTSRIDWPEALNYGYMNYAPGLNFCGNAEESTQSTCAVDFWIGGYGGEFEAGAVGIPSTDTLGGIWVGSALDCNHVSIGSLFPNDVNNVGDEEYNWCNINFQVPGKTNYNVYMGGNGNVCGKVCDTADACPPGGFFAQLFNADGGAQVGTCTWDSSWTTDCASDGSLIYNSLVKCTFMP